MAKFNFKAPIEEQPEKSNSSETGKHQCEVFGCPRLATIKIGNWNCRYHNLRAANALDGITLVLKNHEREINWYEKVLNMPFHEYDLFKNNAPSTMLPHANEDLIQYRKRISQYVSDMFKHAAGLKIPVTNTYVSLSSEVEI
jgi:hypothetical protein